MQKGDVMVFVRTNGDFKSKEYFIFGKRHSANGFISSVEYSNEFFLRKGKLSMKAYNGSMCFKATEAQVKEYKTIIQNSFYSNFLEAELKKLNINII